MRTILRVAALTAAILSVSAASAQEFGEPGPEEPLTLPEENMVEPPPVSDDVPLDLETAEEPELDKLFAQLKKASNKRFATSVAQNIWKEWYRSGSATIDLMMTWANDAFEGEQYNVALDYLDQVVMRRPDFAEGWNRRATVHYAMNNFAKSMSDIERTLDLEPRHFGAMSGMATILERTGNKKAALNAWERTLEIYPAMQSAQQAVIRLSDELAADAI